MARLPARHKLVLLCFRRSDPDEILVVLREARGVVRWAFPSTEQEAGEHARDAALRLASQLVRGLAERAIDLGTGGVYRVSEGPSAGAWTERAFAIEVAPGSRALEGRWLPHYEAKAEAGADAPRAREAVTRLREMAKLKP